jgi:hypothetical protein
MRGPAFKNIAESKKLDGQAMCHSRGGIPVKYQRIIRDTP